MANEINFAYPTGLTDLRATIRNWNGKVWNGSTFEDPVDANWATYLLTPLEDENTGIYRVAFPTAAAMVSGEYTVTIYRGTTVGSPAVIDLAIDWSKEFAATEGMLAALYRRFFGKVDLTKATGAMITYDDAGTGAEVTQTLTDDGSVETQGRAS